MSSPQPTLTETILSLTRQRIASGTTIYRIAQESGVRRDVLAKYLSGEKIPRGDTLDSLADWLGVEVRERRRRARK